MISVMLYILFVSCIVVVSALLAERVLAALDAPRRGLWLVALLASIVLPVWSFTSSTSTEPAIVDPVPAAEEPAAAAGSALETPQAGSGSEAFAPDWRQWAEWSEWSGWSTLLGPDAARSPAWNDALIALWVAGSILVLLVQGLAWLSLRRALRHWPREQVCDTPVSVSDGLGPAVFGVREPRIIVPRWLLDASRSLQSTVLRHEREHLAAKDTWLLTAAILPVALVPWNPVMWWLLRRLRTTVELDCDARVVRCGADAAGYAGALLTVAQRRAALGRALPMLGAVASTGSMSQLERRVRQLLERPRPNRFAATLCGAGAAVAIAAAWALQPPAAAQTPSADPSSEQMPAREHEPITGLATGGERIVVLVDVSADMLDRTAEGVQQRLALPADQRRRAPKWQHLVEVVDSVAARIPSGASFQVILFDDEARTALPDTDGQWLTATPELLERSVDVLRNEVVPADARSRLQAAFDAANELEPPPDTVHLIVDGLPSTDDADSSEAERLELLAETIKSAPERAAVNVLLLPKEGEAAAAPGYWALTQRTGGGLFAPVEGAMQSAVPGVRLDADYLVFVVDTSGSMRQYAWDAVERHMRDTLDAHPRVAGLHVLNDRGEYLFRSYRNEWIPDTPSVRQAIFDALPDWNAFSASSPGSGIEEAIDDLYYPGLNVAMYTYGDDFAQGDIDETLELIERVNRVAETGAVNVRINAVAMPVYLEVAGELLTAHQYAALMRELSERSGGAFIALSEL